jgi:hypothetical protein
MDARIVVQMKINKKNAMQAETTFNHCSHKTKSYGMQIAEKDS